MKKLPEIEHMTDEVEVENFLMDNCYMKTQGTVSVPYSAKEIQELEHLHTEANKNIAELEDEKKTIIDGYKEKIKPFQKAFDKHLEEVMKGTKVVEMILYGMKSPDGSIKYYNFRGEEVDHTEQSDDIQVEY